MISVAHPIISFQLSGMFSQTVRQIFFFSISEAKRSRFFSIKVFSFCSFVSSSKTTKDLRCVFGEVCLIPDTERKQGNSCYSCWTTSVFMTISPNLTLSVLVLIKLPSLLSFPAGETLFRLFIFQRQKHCLFYLNLMQLDETLYGTQCYIWNP